LEIGIALSRQLQDISERTLELVKKNDFEISEISLALGSTLKSNVYEFKFLTDSFEAQPGSRYDVMSEGTELRYYALSRSPSKLENRLRTIISEAKSNELEAGQLKEMIGLRIMYADLPTTDVPKLAKELMNRF